ncbi:Uncharacterised protein [Mycobacteroides abscessus subsp. abscessus]|nr:Uncharacterised protein [Mycobacteroides abscessus subsp. abscessus]
MTDMKTSNGCAPTTGWSLIRNTGVDAAPIATAS